MYERVSRTFVRLTSTSPLALLLGLYWVVCAAVLVDYYPRVPATTVRDAGGRILSGDYVAFHTGAATIHRGEGRDLYDLEHQRGIQAQLDSGGLYPYVYPASLAVVLSPLAALPYGEAFLGFNAVNFLLGLGAALLLGSVVPRLSGRGALFLFAATAAFPPLARTWLAGGQTTVITLFLLAGATWGVVRERPVVAGLFLGLLGYKPQLLLPFVVVLVAWRAWRTLAVMATVGVGQWGVGALACGVDWPLRMLKMLSVYKHLERDSNFGTHVSFLAVCERALPGGAAQAVAIVLVVATLALLAWLANGGASKRLAWAAAAAACLLTAPHAQYYDVAILVVPALLLLEEELERGVEPSTATRALLLAAFFVYPLYPNGAAWGFQPLVLLPVATLAWAASRALGCELSRPEPALVRV